ncbi:MAG: T9SS type A sorting domain-containing protein [Sphingobacteriales bacterium]|nr:T9SS type A sorting domain-containing protein [Sphingobacteriales bacterium]
MITIYRRLLWVIPACILIIETKAQLTADTLKVVNWNMEWFGSVSNGPGDVNVQQANAQTVIQNLNADVYALVEVVDIARLQNIVNAMPGYSLIVSDFCSSGSSVASCAIAQKLAFVYRNSKVNKVRTYGVLRSGGSSTASYNWAAGRFPFLMEADVTLNNTIQRISFIVIHAKANTGTSTEKITSYNRRRDGITEVRDSLNLQYPTSNFILLGDYNDDLDNTIVTELLPVTASSYSPVLNQPDKYVPVTLPLSLANQSSTAFFPNIIDHVMLSNEMNNYYVANSAKIMKQEVESWVTNYANTTSDHYPVQTKYFYNSTITGINSISNEKSFAIQSVIHNGFNLDVFISDKKRNRLNLQLIDLNGRVLLQQIFKTASGINKIVLHSSVLASGIYFLKVNGSEGSIVQKVVIY